MKLKLFIVFVIHLVAALDFVAPQSIIEREQKLSDKFRVSWTVDFTNKSVTFIVTGETRGFVGFGLSPNGGMAGADVIIGGVLDDGVPYFSDRFATKTEEPKIDDHQDWFLISASENSTHTILTFERTFDTCDPQDLPLTNDTTKFIWSLGETDEISYHGPSRGAASVNVLDPPMPVYDTSKFEIWNVTINTTIPATDTTYWCSVHKSPQFFSKRQLVGFQVNLESEGALYHNHHLNLHHCPAGQGSQVTDLLESFVGHPGGLCYDPDDTNVQQLFQFCQSSIFVWAKGGEPLFLPENVGYPLNEDGSEEYFFLEIHYDNPDQLAGVSYETGVTVFTTDELRPIDAGLMVLGYRVDVTQTIPPASREFVYPVHCSSRCTASQIPEEGIQVFNVLHHAHLSGRKLKFRHFRPQADNGKFMEMPWISYDDNYDFNFQQNRPLKQPIKILPGDHFTGECTYDTTWKNPPTATFGGFATKDEMCDVIFLYYPKIDLGYCGSYHPLEALLPILGIDEIDEMSSPMDPIVLKPEEFSGTNFSTVLNTMLDWTAEVRDELQQKVRYNDHVETCQTWSLVKKGGVAFAHKEDDLWTNYPEDFEEYAPPESNCEPISN